MVNYGSRSTILEEKDSASYHLCEGRPPVSYCRCFLGVPHEIIEVGSVCLIFQRKKLSAGSTETLSPVFLFAMDGCNRVDEESENDNICIYLYTIGPHTYFFLFVMGGCRSVVVESDNGGKIYIYTT